MTIQQERICLWRITVILAIATLIVIAPVYFAGTHSGSTPAWIHRLMDMKIFVFACFTIPITFVCFSIYAGMWGLLHKSWIRPPPNDKCQRALFLPFDRLRAGTKKRTFVVRFFILNFYLLERNVSFFVFWHYFRQRINVFQSNPRSAHNRC